MLPRKADASGNALSEPAGWRFCLYPRRRLDFLRGFSQGLGHYDNVMRALGSYEPRNGGYKTSGPDAVDLERCDFMWAPWMPTQVVASVQPRLHAITHQMYLDDDKPRTFEYKLTAEELENVEDILF